MTDHQDVYNLVVHLSSRFDEWVAIRERVGGDDAVLRMAGEHNQLVADMPIIKRDLEELGDTTLGSRQTDLQGGGRNEDGIVHDIAEIKEKVNGGGLSNSDLWRLRVSTAASVLTFVGVIVAAIIVS